MLSNKKSVTNVVLCISVLICICGVSAGTPRCALVVGNSAYSGNSALKNPVNDATAMASALKHVGWSVILATDVDRRSFNRAISSFRDSLAGQEGADALFFYAGHGMQVYSRK